ncbi:MULTISPECIES: ferredoxin family protein [unclassified Adlercreutzia]|uniref:ferredoxin family protein n=1 Tax=unclassified Adlercreutzia TaxID=2636013 RepID=UPI0013ED86A4|nr:MULTISPECIES: ferredoxin family protein [unclassified Adlercreutzia]
MSVISSNVNIDKYLSLNKYDVDNNHPHIVLTSDPDDEEFDKLVRVCPAALYKRRDNGLKSFDYSGCLECGTCRVVCGDTILEKWEYPRSGMGVEYRYG